MSQQDSHLTARPDVLRWTETKNMVEHLLPSCPFVELFYIFLSRLLPKLDREQGIARFLEAFTYSKYGSFFSCLCGVCEVREAYNSLNGSLIVYVQRCFHVAPPKP